MAVYSNESGTIKTLTMEQGGGLNLSGIDDLGSIDISQSMTKYTLSVPNLSKYKFLICMSYYISTEGNNNYCGVTSIIPLDEIQNNFSKYLYIIGGADSSSARPLRISKLDSNNIELYMTASLKVRFRILGIY